MSESKPDFPITIGNVDQFSLKIDLDKNFGDEWLFGRVMYLIGGISVGDFELSTSLRDVYLHMYRILWDANNRSTERFHKLPAGELFETVWSAIYGNATAEQEELSMEECWVKHRITLPADVFKEVCIFQFDEEAKSRIIWRSFANPTDSSVHEVVVPTGTTESVYLQLNELLESLSLWEKKHRLPRKSD